MTPTTETRAATRNRVQAHIRGDLRPVRPLLAPGVRLLLMLPLAIGLGLIGPWLALRSDMAALGVVLGWGLWALQWSLGLLILGVALRQAVPGLGLPSRALTTLAIFAWTIIVGITVITYAVDPSGVPAGYEFLFWWECFWGPIRLALPLLAVATLLAMRAAPTRPALVGGLCGLGVGVLSDSGWRLACQVTAPSHIFGAHFAGLTALTALGAVIGWLVERRTIRASSLTTGDSWPSRADQE